MRLGAGIALGCAIALGVARAAADPQTPAEVLKAAYTAYERGDIASATRALDATPALTDAILNRDYVVYLRASIALLERRGEVARRWFTELAGQPSSRFASAAKWRAADALWVQGEDDGNVELTRRASKEYDALRKRNVDPADADLTIVALRQASLLPAPQRAARLKTLLITAPGHPTEPQTMATLRALAPGRPLLSTAQQLDRIANLAGQRDWEQAMRELTALPTKLPPALALRRQFLTGDTLFRMRQRYADAGRILLSIYTKLGKDAPRAMFRGARALSRADQDDEAIRYYQALVAKYPKTDYAEEAAFLAGWLEFNRGAYEAALAPLQAMIAKYPRSSWRNDAEWFVGYAYFLLGRYPEADAALARLAKNGEEQLGGKAQYWQARARALAGDTAAAMARYQDVVDAWPLTWYATLARARLAEAGVAVAVLGKRASAASGPAIESGDVLAIKEVAADPLIQRVLELRDAGLVRDAGIELERGEKALRGRFAAPRAWAILHALYPMVDRPNRLFRLALANSGGALRAPPLGNARRWWQATFPRAFAAQIEGLPQLGTTPPELIYSIMRVESGYDPHVVSFADAQGLLQMIPPTTERVAQAMGMSYAPGDLFQISFNLATGTWYIAKLFAKFGGQIPLVAASYNGGPGAMMRWLDDPAMRNRPIDEFVELVPYRETREYMKRVTTHYTRYMFLYHGTIYAQPLALRAAYSADEINY